MDFALLLYQVSGELGRKPSGGLFRLVDEVLQEGLVLPFRGDGDRCKPFLIIQRKRRAAHEKREQKLPKNLDERGKLVIEDVDVPGNLSHRNGLKLSSRHSRT